MVPKGVSLKVVKGVGSGTWDPVCLKESQIIF